ncbi:Holliday junction DNA helicase subunit RuvA [Mesonia phycicola]|uniref:Holliday junction branch migration complex subunit RuvA n=1 Tax=Mesonia phycicola TaxID=579105 RepID=A0A1M6EUX5_9FLAO|nr:Holliday junction branch migration protein RuvA [Mesonia phycicola]SHI89253.1 Holliday junction DNA helicase subunit RuvA [Mesonia phycicola]
MISHLKGKLVEKNPTDITVECNGVGYFLNISLNTYSQLPAEENIFIYVYLQVREDAHTLFGFMQKSEREIFKKLISVSGIGASTARTMLSSLTPLQVVEAITQEEVAIIQSVKGIGAKTAQRVIIDLKDKLSEFSEDVNEIVKSSRNTHKEEALSALETLGYTRKQSEKVVSRIIKNDAEASVETIIKFALKNL